MVNLFSQTIKGGSFNNYAIANVEIVNTKSKNITTLMEMVFLIVQNQMTTCFIAKGYDLKSINHYFKLMKIT
jgi:hypothetical protein